MRGRRPRLRGLRDRRTGPAARGGAQNPGYLGSWSLGALSRGGRAAGTNVDPATPPPRFAHAPPPRTHAGHVRRLCRPPLARGRGPSGQVGAHRNVQTLPPAALFRSSPAHQCRSQLLPRAPLAECLRRGGGMVHAGEGKIEQRSRHGHVLRAGNLTARPAGVLDLHGTRDRKLPSARPVGRYIQAIALASFPTEPTRSPATWVVHTHPTPRLPPEPWPLETTSRDLVKIPSLLRVVKLYTVPTPLRCKFGQRSSPLTRSGPQLGEGWGEGKEPGPSMQCGSPKRSRPVAPPSPSRDSGMQARALLLIGSQSRAHFQPCPSHVQVVGRGTISSNRGQEGLSLPGDPS